MFLAGEAVESEVLDPTRKARCGREGINDREEIEFVAQLGDKGRLPVAARFPGELELAAFGAFEEATEVGDVFGGGGEAGRALKDDDGGVQLARHGKCFVPGPADGGVKPEVAAVLPVVVVEAGAPVGGTGRTMGDDLPGFERELEFRRHDGAPAGGGCQFWQLMEGGGDFDARECPGIRRLRAGKAATADVECGRSVTHAREV